jgi:hypothetical protein
MAKNLLHHHPSLEIRAAAVALCDALTQYERSTQRQSLVILKVDAPGGPYEYRSLGGGPVSEFQSDVSILEVFRDMLKG